MTPARSLSIIVPAYCEAGNILDTLENITAALAPLDLPHEILVVDDGSTDGTGTIVSTNLARFPNTRLLSNDRNRGFGWTYRRGVREAALDYIVMVHGDNAWGAATLRNFFGHVGQADVVIGYTDRMWRSRTWVRTLTSKTLTLVLNLITWRWLQYYNGLQIHPAPVLKSMEIESVGFGFQPEVLVKGLRATGTFVEVPIELTERQKGESKGFRVKNLVDLLRTLKLIWSLERRG